MTTDHILPTMIVHPPNARGSADATQRPRSRSRNAYPTPDDPGEYQSRRDRQMSQIRMLLRPAGDHPYEYHSPVPREPGADYDPEHDRRELEEANSYQPETAPGHDLYRHNPEAVDYNYEEDDLPREGESVSDWVNRTSRTPQIQKCDACKGRGSKGPYGKTRKCIKCKGSGYLDMAGKPHAAVRRLVAAYAAAQKRKRVTAAFNLREHLLNDHAIEPGLLGKHDPHYLHQLHHEQVSDELPSWDAGRVNPDGTVGGEGPTNRFHVHGPNGEVVGSKKVGYGEIKAPANVDTLRDEECPVCGEGDAFDGNECQVCGYVAPPEMFTDPDLDLASELDLRKDVAQDAASDPNNDGMPDKGLDPDQKMQYPTAPGMAGDMGEQADPNAPEMGGAMPMDPNALPDPDDPQQAPIDPTTGQPVLQQPEPGPLDPAMMQPGMGQPMDVDNDGTVDVSIPQSDTVAPDGQVYEAPENDPAAALVCPSCGFQTPAAPPQSLSTDPMDQQAMGPAEGDLCPNCQQGLLTSAADMMQPQPDQLSSPVGLEDSPTKGREASTRRDTVEMAPRPVLAAAKAQQKIIEQQARTIEALRREAVIGKSQLAYLAKLAGVEEPFEAIRKRADEMNPAQPVPDPASEGPSETTEQALAPDTNDNVQNIGETPGSVNELGAATTTSPLAPGETLPVDPFSNMQDVTAPVAGTETQLPLPQTKIETDVRVGDPNNPEPAFPWTLGEGAQASNRTMASLRLARLRIAASIAQGDDLAVAASIESSDLSDGDIAHEISTLSAVQKAASRRGRPTNAVPKVASVQRTVPSLSPEAVPLSVTAGLGPDVEDSDLFLGDF